MAARKWCPFIDAKCKKSQSGGACALQPDRGDPVVICPNRLYVDEFQVIQEIARDCFGDQIEFVTDHEAQRRQRGGKLSGQEVVVFGQGFSGEVGITAPAGEDAAGGSFKIDFLLCTVDPELAPEAIVAVEVQTIDTTNSYKPASEAYYNERPFPGVSGPETTKAGFNWENVSKRILPQLIYKGHALRREKKAQHGLFFVAPHAVIEKIKVRVGGALLDYPQGPGTITFKGYSLGPEVDRGYRSIELIEEFTTTVEQLAFAFVSPRNLPDLGIYDQTLTQRLKRPAKKK